MRTTVLYQLMNAQWKNIWDHKPALFDWLVFTISILLSLLFPRLGDLIHAPVFPGLMLAGLTVYVAGLWLKHRPLRERLAKQGSPQKALSYTFFLVTGHWLIMLMLLFIVENAVRRLVGFPVLPRNAPASGWLIFNAILISLLITWLAFRPGKKVYEPANKSYLFWREFIADILLLAAVSLFSFVFWEGSLLAVMGHMRMDSIISLLLLFVFLSFAYVLFYLPLRYLYLLEDNSRQAWRRLLLLFILLLIRGMLESL